MQLWNFIASKTNSVGRLLLMAALGGLLVAAMALPVVAATGILVRNAPWTTPAIPPAPPPPAAARPRPAPVKASLPPPEPQPERASASTDGYRARRKARRKAERQVRRGNR